MDFSKFAKLENSRIVYPPHNSGNLMNCHRNAEWLAANGFAEQTDEWFVEHAPKPTAQTVFTKLTIRRAMRSLGIEEKLDALLASSRTFAADWQDAQDIDLADPVLVEALAGGKVSSEEIDAIRDAIQKGGAL